jgi:DNA modification methylase
VESIECTCGHCGHTFRAAPEPVHLLLCGSSTSKADVDRLMDGELASLCFTSPPYAQQRDYTEESQSQDWDTLMRGVFAHLPMAADGQVLVNLGLVHREGEWLPYWESWMAWMREQGWRRFGWYVWDQGSGLPGDWCGRFGPSHEFVFHFNRASVKPDKFIDKKPASIRAKPKDDVGLRGKDGSLTPISNPEAFAQPTKVPDSVIRINRSAEAIRSLHPAVFPVELAAFFQRCWDGLIFEPFSGSGTAIAAATQLGRRVRAIEISPRYVDVAVARWEKLSGKKATLAP